MSRQDDIAAAELAGLVGGHLKSVENSMTVRSSTDFGAQVHPSQFLGRSAPVPQRQTTNNVLPANSVIEPPKSRSAGSEIVGTETVNVRDLMIGTDGMDKEMRAAIEKYSKPSVAPVKASPPTPQNNVQPTPMVIGHATPVQTSTVLPDSGYIVQLLERIEEKLDLILKRAKLQPRYKKGN